MPIKRVFEGATDSLEILDKDGNVDKGLEPKLPSETLDRMYRMMALARLWDRKLVALQRTGRMYTLPPIEGEEAIAVGAFFASSPEDWLFPTYREASIMYYMRGREAFWSNLIWMGLEDGMRLDHKLRCYPFATPIATHLPHAVGASYALKMNGENPVCIAIVGDGGTSEGDFHDALNFAGVWKLPVVFIIANNQYAISVPRRWQSGSETLAQKALAYGMKGVQVDGNDILAVYSAVKEAADHARSGKGPSVIECITYRAGPHTTADDPKRYRDEKEVAYWLERDPIKRMRIYLKEKGIWNENYEAEVIQDATKVIEEAVMKSESHIQDPKDIFRFTYAKMTKDLENQMAEAFADGSKAAGPKESV